MTLIADVFPKLRTPKNLVTSMSKKSPFKGPFGKQDRKHAKTLLKFAWQRLYHIYWSVSRQSTCKKSLLVTCKISRLFPHTLSADDKYSLLNRDNLTQSIQTQLSWKQKTFSDFFLHFSNLALILNIFSKRWPPFLMYFGNYQPRKTWLDQCVKSPVSRDTSKSNMVNAPKHCWNVKDSSFAIFIDHS